MSDDLDCGDNSCMYAKSKGGMRTNGGCRCQLVFRHMGGDLSVDMHTIRRALARHGLRIQAAATPTPEEQALARCQAKGGCRYCDNIRARLARAEKVTP